MSYTPTTWATGDTITAQKMNKLENGVANAGSALIVTVTPTNPGFVMDKTYAEIYEAFKSGIPCYAKLLISSTDDPITDQYVIKELIEPIVYVFKYNDVYRIYTSGVAAWNISNMTLGLPRTNVYQVTTPTDYPTFLRGVCVNQQYITLETDIF